MPKLPRISGKRLVRVLEQNNYEIQRTSGSHVSLRFHEGGTTVVVPVHGNRDLPVGTLRGILRQANISVDELIEMLQR